MSAATAAALAIPASAGAQGLLSAGVGVGTALGDRHKDLGENGRHAAAYVQLHGPIFPIGVRVDAMLHKNAFDQYSTNLLADVVYVLAIPLVQPYALLGVGKYGIGRSGDASGWNGGVGVRVRTPAIAFYAEARRHQRISRDLLTIGISR